MNMKKSLIAMAVAGAVAVPMAAQADAGAYGRVNVALQYTNDDAADASASGVNPPSSSTPGPFGPYPGAYYPAGAAPAGGNSGLGLTNVVSRFGFKGDEDLGNGLTAMYRYEFAVDSTSATIQSGNRLSWIGLKGDFGMVKAGRIWSAWYDYIGWNTDRSWYLGGPGYYGMSNYGGAPSTRTSDTIQYTWGGGGYGSDPFTFSVEATMNPNSSTNAGLSATNDPQDIDHMTVAGMGTFGPVQVNAAYSKASMDQSGGNVSEPSETAIGVRWTSGPLYVGGSYITSDPDTAANNNPSAIDLLATYDMGGGLSGQIGVGSLDADTTGGAGDQTSVFLNLDKALSSRTHTYGEFRSVDQDLGANSITTQVLLVGMLHNF